MKIEVLIFLVLLFCPSLWAINMGGSAADAVPLTADEAKPKDSSVAEPAASPIPGRAVSGEMMHFRRSQGTAPAEIFLRSGGGPYLWPKARQNAELVKYLEDAIKMTTVISLQIGSTGNEVIAITSFKGPKK